MTTRAYPRTIRIPNDPTPGARDRTPVLVTRSIHTLLNIYAQAGLAVVHHRTSDTGMTVLRITRTTRTGAADRTQPFFAEIELSRKLGRLIRAHIRHHTDPDRDLAATTNMTEASALMRASLIPQKQPAGTSRAT